MRGSHGGGEGDVLFVEADARLFCSFTALCASDAVTSDPLGVSMNFALLECLMSLNLSACRVLGSPHAGLIMILAFNLGVAIAAKADTWWPLG